MIVAYKNLFVWSVAHVPTTSGYYTTCSGDNAGDAGKALDEAASTTARNVRGLFVNGSSLPGGSERERNACNGCDRSMNTRTTGISFSGSTPRLWSMELQRPLYSILQRQNTHVTYVESYEHPATASPRHQANRLPHPMRNRRPVESII